jgi:sporulation protein YlmC with PRC-barrel domain
VNVDVVRDVLDKSIVDRSGRQVGRVDGIVLELRAGEPPRVSAVLIGPEALASRLHPTIGRWLTLLARSVGASDSVAARIDFLHIVAIDREVTTDVPRSAVGADALERRLRQWLMKIPGNR